MLSTLAAYILWYIPQWLIKPVRPWSPPPPVEWSVLDTLLRSRSWRLCDMYGYIRLYICKYGTIYGYCVRVYLGMYVSMYVWGCGLCLPCCEPYHGDIYIIIYECVLMTQVPKSLFDRYTCTLDSMYGIFSFALLKGLCRSGFAEREDPSAEERKWATNGYFLGRIHCCCGVAEVSGEGKLWCSEASWSFRWDESAACDAFGDAFQEYTQPSGAFASAGRWEERQSRGWSDKWGRRAGGLQVSLHNSFLIYIISWLMTIVESGIQKTCKHVGEHV